MRTFCCLIGLVLSLSFFGNAAIGGVPELFSYQGKLTTPDGETVSDGTYGITFGLYDLPSGGTQVWTETHPSVSVTEGVFSLILGVFEPLNESVLDGTERYLEVAFDGGVIMPRTRLTSSAYALRIATVDGATGGEIVAPLVLVPESATLRLGSSGLSTTADNTSKIEFSFEDDKPSISLWEPVDSKLYSAAEATKRIELRQEGIIMFGATETDTNLLVTPTGDIVGVGQITMGENSASGIETSVLGFGNTADGDSSSIAGGSANTTTGTISVISGGHANTASGEGAVIGGGAFNNASGPYSTISGGFSNSAAGDYATIPGGQDNVSDGNYSYAGGHRAKALHNGSFVWADQSDEDFFSTADDQFVIRAGGGVGIGTDSPLGQLDVAGPGGDGSVNLPTDAIAAPEILDEPGIASDRASTSTSLIQAGAVMQQILSTTITIPSEGYVVVRGTATLESTGTTSRNQAYLQIDDTPGGGLVDPYYALAGSGDYDSPNREHYFHMSVERVFFMPAGTYTFYLEGLAHAQNDLDAVSILARPFIIATYFPSSYGTVSSAGASPTLR